MKRIAHTALAAVLLAASLSVANAQPVPGPGPRPPEHHYQEVERHNDWRRGEAMRHEDWDHGRRLDWHTYGLREPPPGYEWREVNGTYVLAAITTGIIASILLQQ
jgi:Ni/Co efflux regulator RcnB